MSSPGSVTHWLELLKAGDQAAAQPLWERYYHQLVSRARAALGALPRAAADEEDVALGAYDSFCRAAMRNRFPQLADRHDLWRILLSLTARKAVHLLRRERAAKRGGGTVTRETDLPGSEGDEGMLAQLVGSEPSPELAAEAAEQCRRLLEKLPTDELRSIAIWRMEGYTVKEIALKLGRSQTTVVLKLAVIRDCWNEDAPP